MLIYRALRLTTLNSHNFYIVYKIRTTETREF